MLASIYIDRAFHSAHSLTQKPDVQKAFLQSKEGTTINEAYNNLIKRGTAYIRKLIFRNLGPAIGWNMLLETI